MDRFIKVEENYFDVNEIACIFHISRFRAKVVLKSGHSLTVERTAEDIYKIMNNKTKK